MSCVPLAVPLEVGYGGWVAVGQGCVLLLLGWKRVPPGLRPAGRLVGNCREGSDLCEAGCGILGCFSFKFLYLGGEGE